MISANDDYQQRPGTSNFGDEYERLIPALFALRTICRPDIVDMWLASNANSMGAFDDVIFYVEFEGGQKKAYVIQLKHKRAPITATAFDTVSDDYSITKYQKSFETIMQDYKLKHTSKTILENVAAEDITFIIYTTAGLAQTIDKKVMKKLNLVLYEHDMDEKEFSLLNTSVGDNKCVYQFYMDDKTKGGHNETFLSQFYFYTKQAQTSLVETFIQKIISENFSNFDTNIKLNILYFIKMWVKGDLGGHYKLRKSEFQLKLTELLLNCYLLVPKTVTEFKQADLWNEVVNSAEVTVVENYNDEAISTLWSAVNSILYKYTDRKLRENASWENSIGIKLDGLPKKYRNEVLNTLTLKQVGAGGILTMKCLYIVLWKAGLLPLLLKADDIAEAQNVFAALSISSRQTIRRHVILLFKGEAANLTKYCGNQSVLQTLADVENLDLVQNVLENLKISLQERNPIHLSKIIEKDSGVLQEITMEMVLKMLHMPFTIGKKYNDLPEIYIKRRVSKILLNEEVLKVSDNVFIVNGPGDIVEDIKLITNPRLVINGNNYFKDAGTRTDEESANVVALEEGKELNFQEKLHFCSNKRNCHYLRYYNGDLEWSRSTGNIDDIRKYLINVPIADKTSIKEEDAFAHFYERVNIISSNPGMGKSVMIKRLAETCMEDFWVETILLNNHHKYFTQHQGSHHINFSGSGIPEGAPSVYKTFALSIISALKKQEKVYVLMDAFDEISTESVHPVINLIKVIRKSGYHLWITTRPVHSRYLEKKLNVFATSLNPFTADDQKMFLTKQLRKRKKTNIDAFVGKLQNLISKSFSNWDAGFLGVPLHLQMVVEVFEDKNIADLNGLHTLSTVDLYKAFIDNKLDVYWRKMSGDNINGLSERVYRRMLRDLKDQHAQASLLLFFPKSTLIQIIDLTKIEDFLKDAITGDVGIIVSGGDWEQPTFSHRTFAEFLAATFLASNCQKENIKPLLIALFSEELTVVRNLFDRMLANEQPLHLAVLNNNLSEVDKLLQNRKGESGLDLDLGGRTPLHLAVAWGSRHRFGTDRVEKFNNIIEESEHKVNLVESNVINILEKLFNIQQFQEQCDDILGWRPIDYACHSYSLDALEIMFSKNQPDSVLEYFEKPSLIYHCVKNGYKNILSRLTIDAYISTFEERQNLLHIAVEHSDILEIFLSKCNPSIMRLYFGMNDWKGDLPLTYGAKNGNFKAFQILLKFKVDLNKTNLYGLTALHILVFYDHLECLNKLLAENTIDLNVRAAAHRRRDDTFKNPGHTALYFAINKNNLEIAELLMQHGANVHLKYENYRTLLHVASINGFTDAIQKLFGNGTEIDSVDDSGRTPLHYAAQNNKINSINLLLQLGADVNVADNFGRTPLHYGTQNFRLDQIEFAEDIEADLNKKDNLSRTLLHYAAQKVKVEERIKYLLPIGKDMSLWHHYGTAPAYGATKDDRLANIDFLVNFGANADEGDASGRTPLHYATEQSVLENMECLIKSGADINKTDSHGQTPLFQATQSGNLDAIKLLLQFSPDLDKQNRFQVAPIHVASDKKFNKCAVALIHGGANVNLITVDGCSPLFIAVRRNNTQLAKVLAENKANPNILSRDAFLNGNSSCVSGEGHVDSNNSDIVLSPLHAAIQLGNMKIITLLLELRKLKINQPDNNGWTALHFAAHHGRAECIDNLLDRGADLLLQNKDGSTPLHLAAKQNHCETLEALLRPKRVKAINLVNDETETVLHVACYQGCLYCVKILVEKGADVDQCTREGFTPLNLALNRCHKDVEQYLAQLSLSN